jgi:hypothetical protein
MRRLVIAIILCVSFVCCASIPEIPLSPGGADDVEILLQEDARTGVLAGGSKQLGQQFHPRGEPSLCLTVTDKLLTMTDCKKDDPNQLWYYDRMGGGMLSAHDGVTCITRDGAKISAALCSSEEAIFKAQSWKYMCGAWANGDKSNGRVLELYGIKVRGAEWTGSPDQLWEYKEEVRHSKCQNQQFKTMSFDGSAHSAAKMPTVISMPEEEFTIALWVKGDSGSPFSYATKNCPSAVQISNVASLGVHIADEVANSKLSIAKNGWVHLAVAWQSASGNMTLFTNGYPVFSSTIAKGKKITSGGCLMIGQEQKEECKKVRDGASFIGDISDVMIWDTAYEASTIQDLMISPIHKSTMAAVGRLTGPQPGQNLRLAYLSRQYAAEEYTTFPPSCPLDLYKKKETKPLEDFPKGTMMFSGSGDVHYSNFAGCKFDDQSVGEWVAVRVKEEYWSAAPLMIQYRTSPHKTKCAWCQNGAVAYIDGCAVKYHEDQASIGFGGYDEDSMYEPYAAMNGSPGAQEWQRSPNKRMRVYFGKGGSYKRKFEAQISDGSFIKCSPRSIYITMPKKYTGKIHGIVGTGEGKGKDFESGPNINACIDCTYKEQVPGTEGQCPKHYVYTKAAHPLNGNSISKPIVKMMRSWQVDGSIIPSVFYYQGKHGPGSFNRNAGEKIKPPLETKENAKEDEVANEACKQFRNTPNMRAKCLFDFKMMGPEAIKQSKKDRERQRAGSVKKPDKRSVRDVSRFRNNAEWTGPPSWGCIADLNKIKAEQQEGFHNAKMAAISRSSPIEASKVIIYLNQQEARTGGYSNEVEGVLSFAEVQVYGTSGQLDPAKMELSSVQHPKANYTAAMCTDGKIDTDCRTQTGGISKIVFSFAAKQIIQRIVLLDSRDPSSGVKYRNLGATIILADNADIMDPNNILLWQSDPIRKPKPKYEFVPSTKYTVTNMTQTVPDEQEKWLPSAPSTMLANGSITVAPSSKMLSYQTYSPLIYFKINLRVQAKGAGIVYIDLFSPSKCDHTKGIGLSINHKENKLELRQSTFNQEVYNTAVDFTRDLINVGLELNNGIVTVFVNHKKVMTQAKFKGVFRKGKICYKAQGAAAHFADVEVTQLAPVGDSAKKSELARKKTMKDKSTRKIKRFKKVYAAEKTVKHTQLLALRADKETVAKEKTSKADEAEAKHNKALASKTKELQVKCAEHNRRKKIYRAAEVRAKKHLQKYQKYTATVNATQKQIVDDEAATVKSIQNIKDSTAAIASGDQLLADARSAANTAYTKEMATFRQHRATASKNLSEQRVDENESYSEKAFDLKQVHAQQLSAIEKLHSAQLNKMRLDKSLKTLKTDLIGQTAEAHTEFALLTSASKRKTMLKKELDIKAAANAALDVKTGKDNAQEEKKMSKFDKSLHALAIQHDEDQAFDMHERMVSDVAKGLSIAPTGVEAALQQRQFAQQEIRLEKVANSIKKVTSANKNPQIIRLEKALMAARATEDPAKILAAEKALKDELNAPIVDAADERDLQTLRKALQDAEAKKDSMKVKTLLGLIRTKEEAMDPDSIQGKVVALKKALAKAQKDCFHDPDDPKVKTLLAALKTAQEQSKAEENGKSASEQVVSMAQSDDGSAMKTTNSSAMLNIAADEKGDAAKQVRPSAQIGKV